MTALLSKRVVGVTGALAAALSVFYTYSGAIPIAFFGTQAASNMTLDLNKLGKNMVKKVPSMEQVPLESLWADQAVVITFLRRFGCVFCRREALGLSTLTPILASHGVKNIAVGLEEFGLDEFVEGKFFNGDLYVDIDKNSYKEIGYKRYSTIGVMMSLFSKVARDRISECKRENVEGNLKGDGVQTGGTLIITKGGAQVLLDFRQENPADRAELSDILRALKIPEPEGFGKEASAEESADKK